MTPTIDKPVSELGAADVSCPHCHKQFTPQMDISQPIRFQGAKCPHCKLFVPVRLLPAPVVPPAGKASTGRLTKPKRRTSR